MSSALFGDFVGASAILMLIPGPNVALIVANSLAFGARLMTVAGTSAAMVVQLTIAALRVTALLGALAQAFDILHWLGIAYLVWLGVRAWRAPADGLGQARAVSPRKIFGRGFLVSLANPKTLAFYAAFPPQFLDPSPPWTGRWRSSACPSTRPRSSSTAAGSCWLAASTAWSPGSAGCATG
jgi:homoserine/homoserine lactone efflux protein